MSGRRLSTMAAHVPSTQKVTFYWLDMSVLFMLAWDSVEMTKSLAVCPLMMAQSVLGTCLELLCTCELTLSSIKCLRLLLKLWIILSNKNLTALSSSDKSDFRWDRKNNTILSCWKYSGLQNWDTYGIEKKETRGYLQGSFRRWKEAIDIVESRRPQFFRENRSITKGFLLPET